MNLKLKRVVRTPYSEEIAIFDSSTRDENEDAVSIGKLEVHYLNDQMVGTLLIWAEFAQGFKASNGAGTFDSLDDVIDDILSEVSEALGVSSEYGIEVYYPSVTNQSFFSNYADGEDEADETEGEEYGEETDESEDAQDETDGTGGETRGLDDDYYRKLTGRQ